MTWLEIIGVVTGVLFALASVALMGIIAIFALADREADKQPPRKKR